MNTPGAWSGLASRVATVAVVLTCTGLIFTFGVASASRRAERTVRTGRAASLRLSWSAPFQVEQLGGQQLAAVTCPSVSSCVALDVAGRFVSFNPQAPATHTEAVLDPKGDPAAISCPSPDECIGVLNDGMAYVFDPTSKATGTGVEVDPHMSGGTWAALSCPLTTRCVEVDASGDVVTFNPANIAATLTTTAVLAGVDGGLVAVSCSDGATCTAVGWTQEVTFDPADPSGGVAQTLVANDRLAAVACPSAGECIASDGDGGIVTFDPQSQLPVSSPVVVDTFTIYNELAGLVCTSNTTCVYADQGGYAVLFNPLNNTPEQVLYADLAAPSTYVSALACTSGDACEVVDEDGGAVALDPSGGNPSPRTVIDPAGEPLETLTCPTATECVASSGDQESNATPDNVVEFNPRRRTASAVHQLFKSSGVFLAGLACPATRLCTAVAGNNEATFNPLQFSYPGNGRDIDPQADEGIADIRCPGITECVEVDGDGWAVSFDPSPFHYLHSRINIEGGESLETLSCPSAGECVVVDNNGMMFRFDPLSGKAYGGRRIDAPVGLDAGSGDSDHELDAISCPSTSICVATDTLGNIVSFNPLARRGAQLRKVDAGEALNGIACPRSDLCVAVDGAGHAVTGDPTTGRWTVSAIPNAGALLSVACPSPRSCVVTDSLGYALTAKLASAIAHFGNRRR